MIDSLRILAQPFTLLCIALLLSVARWWGREQFHTMRRQETRSGRRSAMSGNPATLSLALCLTLVLGSTNLAGFLSQGTLEWGYRPLREMTSANQAIVVLGGSIRPPSALREDAELGPDTIYRCMTAAKLANQSPDMPVFVTGGLISAGQDVSLGKSMKRFLIELGISPSRLKTEDRAANTYENAAHTAHLLESLNAKRIVLVTEATHMRRAQACFEKQGLQVTPAPCDFHAEQFALNLANCLPKAGGVLGVQRAAHEWLGLAWYWLRGWI